MNAVLSVIGKDSIGILALVSNECSNHKANIVDVSQTVLRDLFAMIMVVNIDNLDCELSSFIDLMREIGKNKGLDINVMHEDIFNLMHKI